MSDQGYNISGVVAGALGILLALLPLFFAWLSYQMPSAKLRVLQDLMAETESIFRKSLEDGVLTCDDDLYQITTSIWSTNMHIDDLRMKAYALKTWRDQMSGWWHGLSRKMTILCEEVNDIRMQVVETSSRNRRLLAAEGFTSSLAQFQGAQSRERVLNVSLSAEGKGATAALSSLPPSRIASREEIACEQIAGGSAPLPVPSGVEPPQVTLQRSASPVSDGERPRVRPDPVASDNPRRIPEDTPRSADKARKHRATRRDVLRRFAGYLCAPVPVPLQDYRHLPSRRQNHGRGRLKAFVVLLRGDGRVDLTQALSGRAGQLGGGEVALPAYELHYHEEYDGDDESDDSDSTV
ncbi:hypothetical protein OH77DRAFT_1428990 [Trametes cingulata]|nr:hypothetical protein OH77DRAFT_1428990 [Trametes cingulata]